MLAMSSLISAQGQNKGYGQEQEVKLWAAIAVSPIFQAGHTDRLQVQFAIVNDGHSTVNPKVDDSRLFINGVELVDWHFILSNGPRTLRFTAVPPGQSLEFSYVLGKYFQKTGVYTVRWEGKHFRTPDLTFRVLP